MKKGTLIEILKITDETPNPLQKPTLKPRKMTTKKTTLPDTEARNEIIEKVNIKFAGKKSLEDLRAFAREKSKGLQPQTSIRLTADENSYSLINFGGIIFVGSYNDEAVAPMFEHRPIMSLTDADGKEEGKFQRLF